MDIEKAFNFLEKNLVKISATVSIILIIISFFILKGVYWIINSISHLIFG
ncbi:MAG: hypothetical protein ACK4IX_04875 [Candidatus Sericytochromatia bacterium]|jgi:hypothetical protein